jgi:voltage-gated potassium channel
MFDHAGPPRRGLRQTLRANWRDLRVLVRTVSRPMLIFVGTIVFFGFLFYTLTQATPEITDKPSPVEAMFLVLSMIFLQANVSFPDQWYLQIFFFIMPVIGIAMLSAGVANLGVKLFNKSERGQDWEVALAATFSDHVIVCGVGKLGYRVVLQLLKFGQSVVAIDQDPNKVFIPLVRQMDVPVIFGDGRLREVLHNAGIDRASAIVCCTQDDLANLDIALDAREINPRIKVVLRMFDAELASKIERGFGIHTAFSASALAAPAFAAAATRAHIDYSFYVGENLLHVSQVTVDESSPLANREVEDVERTYDLTIVMHQTADEVRMHPHSDDIIHVSDTLVVFASLETLGQLGLSNHQRVSGAKIRQPNQSALHRIFNRSRTSSRSTLPRDAKTHRTE